MKSINVAVARYRYPLVLLLSLLCALAAIWLAKTYLATKEREILERISASQNMTEVVVARRTLPAGSEISAETMSVRPVPEAYVPDGAIRPGNFSTVTGMFIAAPIASGKPLIRHNIKGISRVEKFSDLLAPGERALALEVNGISSVEYMVEAGDVIDLAIRNRKGDGFKPLLERVTVLATGKVTTADPKPPGMYKKAEYQSLTIAVDSSKVAAVLLAESRKELVFLLRNEGDRSSSRYLVDAGRAIEVIVGSTGGAGGLEVRLEETTPARRQQVVARNAEGRLLKRAENPGPEAAVEKE